MSILAGVTSGVAPSGIRMIIAAQEKMGKTTLCSQTPQPLLLPMEVGYAGVQIPRTPMITTYEQAIQVIDEIIYYCSQGQFPYQTVCIDSVTALERFIHEYVIRLDKSSQNGTAKTVTMESAHGGYGKAYTMANTMFSEYLTKLNILSEHYGINIVITAHVFNSKIKDATVGEYDSWDILLHSPKNDKTYGKRELITQWADVIAYLYEPIFLTSVEGKSGMVKGVSQNKGRVLAVTRTPAYTAGNRYDLQGEIPLPPPPQNGWNYFAEALYKSKGIDVYTR